MTKNLAYLSTCCVLVLTVTAAHAIEFNVTMDAAQEVPVPNLGGANPSGSATVDVNTITGDVTVAGSFAGLSSDATAAHLHGLAPAGAAAGVLFGLDVNGTTAGSISGAGNVFDDLDALLDGQTYLNLHTVNNGPGEIRGQLVDSDIRVFAVSLDTAQEIPAPDVGGANPFGAARVVVDVSSGDVEIFGTFTGLSDVVTGAHLHGLADASSTAGVLFGLDLEGAMEGTFRGASTLDAASLAGLLNGQTYLNVHTERNPPGEIRGQVVPEPSSAFWLLPVSLWGTNWFRRRVRSTRGRMPAA